MFTSIQTWLQVSSSHSHVCQRYYNQDKPCITEWSPRLARSTTLIHFNYYINYLLFYAVKHKRTTRRFSVHSCNYTNNSLKFQCYTEPLSTCSSSALIFSVHNSPHNVEKSADDVQQASVTERWMDSLTDTPIRQWKRLHRPQYPIYDLMRAQLWGQKQSRLTVQTEGDRREMPSCR